MEYLAEEEMADRQQFYGSEKRINLWRGVYLTSIPDCRIVGCCTNLIADMGIQVGATIQPEAFVAGNHWEPDLWSHSDASAFIQELHIGETSY